MPIPYTLQADNPFSCEFIAETGIRYAVSFVDGNYVFADYPHLQGQVYLLNLNVLTGDPETTIEDPRVAATMVEIIRSFFYDHQNVALYVCDTLDNRQLARRRKFNIWFFRASDGSLLKEDAAVFTGDDTFLYTSILIHKDNLQAMELISAFRDLSSLDTK